MASGKSACSSAARAILISSPKITFPLQAPLPVSLRELRARSDAGFSTSSRQPDTDLLSLQPAGGGAPLVQSSSVKSYFCRKSYFAAVKTRLQSGPRPRPARAARPRPSLRSCPRLDGWPRPSRHRKHPCAATLRSEAQSARLASWSASPCSAMLTRHPANESFRFAVVDERYPHRPAANRTCLESGQICSDALCGLVHHRHRQAFVAARCRALAHMRGACHGNGRAEHVGVRGSVALGCPAHQRRAHDQRRRVDLHLLLGAIVTTGFGARPGTALRCP